jgi:hypothetical protein
VCDGFFCVVFMVQGDHLHLRASHNIPTSISSVFASVYPAPLQARSGPSERSARGVPSRWRTCRTRPAHLPASRSGPEPIGCAPGSRCR